MHADDVCGYSRCTVVQTQTVFWTGVLSDPLTYMMADDASTHMMMESSTMMMNNNVDDSSDSSAVTGKCTCTFVGIETIRLKFEACG